MAGGEWELRIRIGIWFLFLSRIYSYSYSVFIFESNIFVFVFGFYFWNEYIRIRIRFLFLKRIYSYSYSVAKILFAHLWEVFILGQTFYLGGKEKIGWDDQHSFFPTEFCFCFSTNAVQQALVAKSVGWSGSLWAFFCLYLSQSKPQLIRSFECELLAK